MNYEWEKKKLENRNWVLEGLAGGLAKMAFRQTKITRKTGMPFRISNITKIKSVLCKSHFSRNEPGMSLRINSGQKNSAGTSPKVNEILKPLK